MPKDKRQCYLGDPDVQNLFRQGFKALEVFERTGNRLGFKALQDQIDSFVKEIKEEKLNGLD